MRDAILACWKTSTKDRTLAIRGTSMRPLIVEGDRIVMEPVQASTTIRPGDIVVFESASGLVAHRIIDRSTRNGRTCYREKGDNRFYPTCIDHAAILGKVVQIQKPRSAILLTAWRWRLLGRVLGIYWKVLFRLLDGAVWVKQAVAGSVRTGWAARSVRRLINLPVWLLKRRTGHPP
jgi:signal peptidase I